jgi:C-terminal processing protease CtpA/Prc
MTNFTITEGLSSFGFSVSYHEDKKYLYVSEIYKNSPAYNSKLQVGDIIFGLNKKKIHHLELHEYCHWLLHKENELFEKENYIYLEIERENKILNIGLQKKDLFKNSTH